MGSPFCFIGYSGVVFVRISNSHPVPLEWFQFQNQLSRKVSAVNWHHNSIDVIRSIRCQKQYGTDQIIRRTPSALRNSIQNSHIGIFIILQSLGHICFNIPRSNVQRYFFCKTRTEFLRKNSQFLRSKSETRSLASEATETYGPLMQRRGAFNTPGGAVLPLLPLSFPSLLDAILRALFLGRQILGDRDDMHLREFP